MNCSGEVVSENLKHEFRCLLPHYKFIGKRMIKNQLLYNEPVFSFIYIVYEIGFLFTKATYFVQESLLQCSM